MTRPRLDVPRRTQRVVIEYDRGEFLVMFDDGTIRPAETARAALRLASRDAARNNPGVTVTTIEWRNVPAGFVAPSLNEE